MQYLFRLLVSPGYPSQEGSVHSDHGPQYGSGFAGSSTSEIISYSTSPPGGRIPTLTQASFPSRLADAYRTSFAFGGEAFCALSAIFAGTTVAIAPVAVVVGFALALEKGIKFYLFAAARVAALGALGVARRIAVTYVLRSLRQQCV